MLKRPPVRNNGAEKKYCFYCQVEPAGTIQEKLRENLWSIPVRSVLKVTFYALLTVRRTAGNRARPGQGLRGVGGGGGDGGCVGVPLSGAACTRQTQHRYVGLHPLGTCTRERRASWLGITRHMAGFNYQMELKINSSQCIYESKFAHR